MAGVPVGDRLADSLPQLMNGRLGNEGHGGLSVADVQVKGAGAFPSQRLIGIEEFFDMPALWKLLGKNLNFVTERGAYKRVEMIVLRAFAATLDNLVQLKFGALAELVGALGGGETAPPFDELLGRYALQLFFLLRRVGHGGEEIKRGLVKHMVEQFFRAVFFIGQHQRLVFGRLENRGSHSKELRRALSHGFGGRTHGEGERLAGVGVQAEKGLDRFDRPLFFVVPMAAGLALGMAAHMVGIDSQQTPVIMSAGPPQLPQSYLQGLGLFDRVGIEQLVYRVVARDKRQSIGQFKTLLAQRAARPDAAYAEGGLMNQLEGQPRFDPRTGKAAPSLEQIPCSQAQMFGRQQPDSHHGPRDLVGQQLAYASLDAGGVRRFLALCSPCSLGLYLGCIRAKAMEFFFEGQTLQ